jgi:hypothetical protein
MKDFTAPILGSSAELARFLLCEESKKLRGRIANVIKYQYAAPKEGNWRDKYWWNRDWREHIELVTVDIERLKADLQNKSFSKLRFAGKQSASLLCEYFHVIPDARPPAQRCPHCGQPMRANSDYPEQLSR